MRHHLLFAAVLGGALSLATLNPAGASPSWSPEFGSSGLTGCVNALTFYDGQLVAGGSFRVPTAAGEALSIARWDGAAWHPLGALNGVVRALAEYGGELYAGGSLYGIGGGESFGIARWNGNAWVGLGRGTDGGDVYALRAYDGSLYAGGAFTRIGDGVMSPHIARWNGAAWSALGAGVDGAVRALEVYRGELWVAGDFDHAGTLDAARLARWGSAFGWAVAPNTSIAGIVNALAVYEDDLVVAGSFSTVNPFTTSLNVARFHGATWTWGSFYPFGGGPGPVAALAPFGLDLAAGGGFGAESGWPYEHVALAEQFYTPTRSSPWMALGSGADGDVRVLVTNGTSLYAGGCFTHAGGLDSPGVARWGEPRAADAPDVASPGPRMMSASPNPFSEAVRIRLSPDVARNAGLEVLDLGGRAVATLQGADGAWWDGRNAAGARMPPGVYFARLRATGLEETLKILRLR